MPRWSSPKLRRTKRELPTNRSIYMCGQNANDLEKRLLLLLLLVVCHPLCAVRGHGTRTF